MGTNYYWRPQSKVCKECGHDPSEEIHIGKSSMGWCFALHVTDEIKSLTDWRVVWEGEGAIFDEYGQETNVHKMLMVITDRSSSRHEEETDKMFLDDNHAVRGPNGLIRSAIDGHHCIGHGVGTWDLCQGEFC